MLDKKKKLSVAENEQYGKEMMIQETLMATDLMLVECTKLNTYMRGEEVSKVGKENAGSRVDRGIITKTTLKDCTNIMSMGGGEENEGIKNTAKG